MKKLRYNLKGNISLTLVLVISAILLSLGITLVLTSINGTYASKYFKYGSLADLRAKSCLEESMYRLKTNTSYTGNFTVTFSDGNCSATVQNDPNNVNYKDVAITSNVSTFNFQETKIVDISTNPISVK